VKILNRNSKFSLLKLIRKSVDGRFDAFQIGRRFDIDTGTGMREDQRFQAVNAGVVESVGSGSAGAFQVAGDGAGAGPVGGMIPPKSDGNSVAEQTDFAEFTA
jgi:hypothetical protein